MHVLHAQIEIKLVLFCHVFQVHHYVQSTISLNLC